MHRSIKFAFLLAFGFLSGSEVHADVWIAGHGDIGVALNANNQLDLHIHFEDAVTGQNGTIAAGEYEAGDHQIGVPGPFVARPAGSQWDFLGPVGSSIWFLPQGVSATKPFLGFASEELTAADWTGDLKWTLNSVTGPMGSNFSVYGVDQFGTPTVRMATSDGISLADTFDSAVGGHEHLYLAFTATGPHQIEFKVEGQHKTFGTLSDTATYTFNVGVTAVPEPTSILLTLVGVGAFGAARIRRRKQAADLVA
jgi:hypothetical protein